MHNFKGEIAGKTSFRMLLELFPGHNDKILTRLSG